MTQRSKRRRHQKWKAGDIFVVPISRDVGLDVARETTYIGQVISYEPRALDSALCAFFDMTLEIFRSNEALISDERLICLQFVTRDLLDYDQWHVVGWKEPLAINAYLDLRKFEQHGFIGVRIRGSAIIKIFLAAFRGLLPWDYYKDPDYFDQLLLRRELKPKELIYKQPCEQR